MRAAPDYLDDEEGRRGTSSAGVPLDTAREAHAVQRDIYERMGGAARLAIAFRLTDSVRRLAMAGIQARHPEYTSEQLFHAWARLKLGDALARSVWPDRDLIDP